MERNFGGGMSKNAHRSLEKPIPEAEEDGIAGAGNCRSCRNVLEVQKFIQNYPDSKSTPKISWNIPGT